MTSITIEPITATLGAEVSGFDMADVQLPGLAVELCIKYKNEWGGGPGSVRNLCMATSLEASPTERIVIGVKLLRGECK